MGTLEQIFLNIEQFATDQLGYTFEENEHLPDDWKNYPVAFLRVETETPMEEHPSGYIDTEVDFTLVLLVKAPEGTLESDQRNYRKIKLLQEASVLKKFIAQNYQWGCEAFDTDHVKTTFTFTSDNSWIGFLNFTFTTNYREKRP